MILAFFQEAGTFSDQAHDYVGYGIALFTFIVGTVFSIKQYRDAKAAKKDADDAKAELAATRHELAQANAQLADLNLQQMADMADSQRRHDSQMALLEDQRKQLETQAGQLRNQADQLRDAALNKPVAKFPDNIDALANFILRTEHEIRIMTDCLGYALYSNPEGHRRYMQAIETVLKRGCKVRLVLYSLDTLRAAVARQIPPGEDNQQWDEERKSDRCINFFKELGKEVPRSYQEFRDVLLTKEQELMARLGMLTKGPDEGDLYVRVRNRRFSAFCWIRDSAESNTPHLAMFAFRNDGMGEGGLTFSTTDASMVADFKGVFEAEFERGDAPIYRDRW